MAAPVSGTSTVFLAVVQLLGVRRKSRRDRFGTTEPVRTAGKTAGAERRHSAPIEVNLVAIEERIRSSAARPKRRAGSHDGERFGGAVLRKLANTRCQMHRSNREVLGRRIDQHVKGRSQTAHRTASRLAAMAAIIMRRLYRIAVATDAILIRRGRMFRMRCDRRRLVRDVAGIERQRKGGQSDEHDQPTESARHCKTRGKRAAT